MDTKLIFSLGMINFNFNPYNGGYHALRALNEFVLIWQKDNWLTTIFSKNPEMNYYLQRFKRFF